MNSADALFFVLSTGAWISAAQVLRAKNPVHAVFYLVLTFLHASGLLLMLGLEYFALLLLLVYIGALAIMFLFVVMLLHIPSTELIAHQRGTYPVAGLLFLALVGAVFGLMMQPLETLESVVGPAGTSVLVLENAPSTLPSYDLKSWQTAASSQSHLTALGVALYGVHVDLLVLASLVLLVAMMGAVALTLKRRVDAPLHDVFVQHSVDFQKGVYKIPSASFERFSWISQTERSERMFI
jgi:NADH-quinone oxidoreductase subunit J